MTKVGELIEKLQEFDPEMEVITSIDPEGNGFNPVYLTLVGQSFYDGESLTSEGFFEEDQRWYDDDDEDKETFEEWCKRNEVRKVVVI
jgi:hypothetical protein